MSTKQLISKLDEHILSERKRSSTIPNKPLRTIEKYPSSTRDNRPIETKVQVIPKAVEKKNWLPENNTKSPEIMNTQLTYANITKNAFVPQNSDNAPEKLQPCHKETMVLKNLLGITATQKSQEPHIFPKPQDGACGPRTVSFFYILSCNCC